MAIELIDRAIEALGAGIASAVNLLDVSSVVIGGGLGTRLGEPYVARIREAMQPAPLRGRQPARGGARRSRRLGRSNRRRAARAAGAAQALCQRAGQRRTTATVTAARAPSLTWRLPLRQALHGADHCNRRTGANASDMNGFDPGSDRSDHATERPRLPPGRRLRPACGLQLGRAGQSQRIDRLAVPAALRQRSGAVSHPRSAAGHWSIRPAEAFTAKRRYLPGTLVIETTFTTETGRVRLTDAMAFAEGQRGHDLGYDVAARAAAPGRGDRGDVELVMELAPRPEFGLYRPLIRLLDDGVRTFGGTSPLRLRAGVPVEARRESTVRSAFTIEEGDSVGFALRWLPVEAQDPPRAHRSRRRAGAHRRHRGSVALMGGRA